MKTLTMLSQKGGTGKSSIAFHLQAMFAHDGYVVTYADEDGQGSIIPPYQNDPCDVKIVDTPGHMPDAKALINWIKPSDVIVVPVLPTRLNVEPYMRIRYMLKSWEQQGKKIITVINQYNPNYLASQHFYEWYKQNYPHDLTVTINQSEVIKHAAEYQEGIISETYVVGRQLKQLYDVCHTNLFGTVRRS